MAEETRLSRRDGNHGEVARIRADIEQTRVAMGDTLNQIQDRLSPARLKEQAKEKVREATIGRVKQMARNAGDKASDASRGFMDVVRENPVPLALIGLGAGWLFMSSRRRSAVDTYDYHDNRLLTERAPIGYEAGYVDQGPRDTGHDGVVSRARETVSGATHAVEDRVADAAGAVREKVSDVGHTVQDSASGVAHRVGDVASNVGARVSAKASSVRHSASDAMLRAKYQYEEKPWFGAAVAIGLGVAAGLAIPGTRREDELMGERRDELLDRARELSREKIASVRTVAQEAIADTREAVQEAIADTRTAVKESIREHAREEGLTHPREEGLSTSDRSMAM